MQLIFQFFLLALGLGLLWKVGELAVQNAIGFSDIFGIHRFTIGFFLFATSTGLPEISSAVVSSLKKIPELSAGNLMGSTFVNLSWILGIVALLGKNIEIDLPLRKKLLWTSGLILLVFAGLVFAHFSDLFIGILLILLYCVSFFLFQTKREKGEAQKEIAKIEEKIEKIEKKPFISPKVDIVLRLTGSLIMLLLSSWLTIHAAANVAKILEISLPIIGATLIAVGTCLPELSLEIHAVKKKEYDLALGDIFGSSLLNVSFILGMLILMNEGVNVTIAKRIFPFVIAAIGWAVLRIYPKKPLRRIDGYVFLGLFALYITTLVLLQNGLLAL